MFGLDREEMKVMRSLSTPSKIHDFLDTLPVNWEKNGDTIMSPRRVLRERKAHCLEAALFAATALWIHGEEPLIVDLSPLPIDDGHVIAIYKRRGHWGAFSKTNHGTIRSRDPVYRTVRELAVSYFHEYFINETGQKTLRTYTKPFNLKRLDTEWITSEENLDHISLALDELTHYPFIPRGNERLIRKAHKTEREAGSVIEWERSDPRT